MEDSSREIPAPPTDYDVKSISSSSENDKSLDAIANLPQRGKNTKDELPSIGMTCDVKNLWEGKKKCPCCINWVEEYPTDVTPNPEETEAVQQFALIVRNRKNHTGTGKAMNINSIVVQSPLLKPLLEEVFEGYEGITATLKKVVFAKPFAPFFYRWSRFQKAVQEVEDDDTREHAQLLHRVLSSELDETITTCHDLLSHGVITFTYLWTLFKPGDILLCRPNGEEMLMRLQSSVTDSGSLTLYCKYVDWNGETFGYAAHTFIIHQFNGTRAITDLEAYPIQFNPDVAAIEHRLAARGRKFEKLQGYHYKTYKGIAELSYDELTRKNTNATPSRHRNVDGRVIIDAATYNHFNASEGIPLVPLYSTSFAPNLPNDESRHNHPHLLPPPPPPPDARVHHPHMMIPPPPPPPPMPEIPETTKVLTEDLYPLCSPIVKGYSLKTKTWAKFKVDRIGDIAWDDRAFDNLVLPSGYKELILSFTSSQDSNEGLLDDVIEGKGQGIVMLLNGEPGVGKTLTAESVAEHMRVPLYSMSAAQLGVDSEEVEQSLADIIEMVTKWKAILLLDETEVFLEQRTIDGLERNKLVSIFLRMLEYYRGVLFLTTNRVAVLDKALESRIHLRISYPELDHAARLQVWRNLTSLLPPSAVGLGTSDLEILAQEKMNGREIKNVIKAAQLLAKGEGKPLGLEHIYTVLRITQIGGQFGAQA